MKAILSLLALCLVPLLTGFRSVSPEDLAREVIQRVEQKADRREHVEVYRYVRATRDGKVYEGTMLVIFRYGPGETNGVYRILPDDDNAGVTLISQQAPGELPRLSHYDANTKTGGPVDPGKLRQKVGDTDWLFESISQEENSPLKFTKANPVTYRGETAEVIEARYNDPALRDSTGYDHRRFFIRQRDSQPVAAEFYNGNQRVTYAMELISSQGDTPPGQPAAPKQLQLTDYAEGSTTTLTRVASDWDLNLPDAYYQLDYADDWNEQTDAFILQNTQPATPDSNLPTTGKPASAAP